MSHFNADELNPPSWMNNDFFVEVLRKCEKTDSILIKESKLSPASAKGDHYASIMFRANVIFDTSNSKGNSKSLIIKTMPEEDGDKKDFIGETSIFETEISMYTDTIPKFEAELRKIGDDTVLGASILYYSLKPKKVVVFEDICLKGYEVMRNKFCNLEEVKAAFLKLAKWHAVSYKLAAEGDTIVTGYKESFLNFKDIEEIPSMVSGIVNFADKLETLSDLKQYVPKLRAIEKGFAQRSVNSTQLSRQKGSEGVFVLCHGDFHRKNMMFKHNSDGKLEDVMLIDFQVCYYGPAVLDLLYGMYLLADAEMRLNNFEELIYYYSLNFIECLEKLKFKGNIPKVSDFYIDLLRHSHWELFLLTSFLPLWNAVSTETGIEDLMSSNEARKKCLDNEEYLKEVRAVLPKMFYKGYLE